MDTRSFIARLLVGTIALGAIPTVPALAENPTQGAPIVVAQDATKRSTQDAAKLINRVASLNEDFVEFGLTGNAAKAEATAKAIADALPSLKAVLSQTTFADVQNRVHDQRVALDRGDMTAAQLDHHSISLTRFQGRHAPAKARGIQKAAANCRIARAKPGDDDVRDTTSGTIPSEWILL